MKLAISVLVLLALAACGPAPLPELEQLDAGSHSIGWDAGADGGHPIPVPIGRSCPDAGGAVCACIRAPLPRRWLIGSDQRPVIL